MRKKIIPLLFLLSFLAACGSEDSGEGNPSLPADQRNELLSELSRDALTGSPSQYDLAPRGFTTPEGIPGHQFEGVGTMDFKATAALDGQYLLLMTLQGEGNIQVAAESRQLGFSDLEIPVTTPGEYGIRKLLDLTAGEYTFTAKSLTENACGLTAFLRPVQKLEKLPVSLTGDLPYTYLCTFPEEATINYTFQDLRDDSGHDTYGTMVSFYNVNDSQWSETVTMENGDFEASGSVRIPAGDILICFCTSDWNITFK